MAKIILFSILFLSFGCSVIMTHDGEPAAVEKKTTSVSAAALEKQLPPVSLSSSKDPKLIEDLSRVCLQELGEFPGQYNEEELAKACQEVAIKKGCYSVEARPIYHYQKEGSARGKRILVFGMVHGDEIPGGSVARQWMSRLPSIDPRNSWLIVPVLNPDGVVYRTRTNARKVDLNRNFPSSDWDENALKYWQTFKKSDPRRYPGPFAASEPETECAMTHIRDYRPDLIIAIHTPLGVLDFDGPRVAFPKFEGLPWLRLGHFPGSLGRYMWRDHNVPVLTIELKGHSQKSFERFDRLQDITGTIALRAHKVLRKRAEKAN